MTHVLHIFHIVSIIFCIVFGVIVFIAITSSFISNLAIKTAKKEEPVPPSVPCQYYLLPAVREVDTFLPQYEPSSDDTSETDLNAALETFSKQIKKARKSSKKIKKTKKRKKTKKK